MTSALMTYRLSQYDGILQHGDKKQKFVRDRDELPAKVKMNVEAQVRSGDYFVTLAMVLDQLAEGLPHLERLEIERIVSDLIYLQDTYKITKNKTE